MQHLLTKYEFHVNQFFPGWQSSGKTYMIPPSPISKYTGPIEEGASGFDAKAVAKRSRVIRGDSAESKIHKFWSNSKRHAFVLQNFTIRSWISAIQSHTHQTLDLSGLETVETEIDYLVLDRYLGIILMECKAVANFKSNRYTEAKDQLDKGVSFIRKIIEFLISTEEHPGPSTSTQPMHESQIPIKKVISFPFVKMNEKFDDPINLGSKDLGNEPERWFDSLGEESTANFFTDQLFKKLICMLLGMYSSVTILSAGVNIMDVYRQIDEQSFLKDSSPSVVYKVTQRDLTLLDQFFFLNPEQHQVWHSPNNNQIIGGCPGTGKTVLLMRKAMEAILNSRSVVILLPKCLQPKYQQFLKGIQSLERKFQVFTFEVLQHVAVGEFDDKDIFVDEFQMLFETDSSTYDKKNVRAFIEANKAIGFKLRDYFCMRSDMEQGTASLCSEIKHHKIIGRNSLTFENGKGRWELIV